MIDFLCFRTVASLDNGDIVVGTNDGTIRIFSRDPSRYNQLNYIVPLVPYIISPSSTHHINSRYRTVQDATSTSVPETDI